MLMLTREPWDKANYNCVTNLIQMLSDRIMVRVGGGWKSLDHFLLVHDPCRIEEMRLCKLCCQTM